MLDKFHVVNVPEGAIVKRDRNVLWTIRKNYVKEKKWNNDNRKLIGKTLEADPTKMYPNDNFKELFPDDYAAVLKGKPLPSLQSIGMYLAVKTIVEKLPLFKVLDRVFGRQNTNLILD